MIEDSEKVLAAKKRFHAEWSCATRKVLGKLGSTTEILCILVHLEKKNVWLKKGCLLKTAGNFDDFFF